MAYFCFKKSSSPLTLSPIGAVLILLRIIRLDGFGLDDDGRVSPGEGAAFGGDGARDVAGRQSQSHGNGGGKGHCQVLDRLREALFLCFGEWFHSLFGYRLLDMGYRRGVIYLLALRAEI